MNSLRENKLLNIYINPKYEDHTEGTLKFKINYKGLDLYGLIKFLED